VGCELSKAFDCSCGIGLLMAVLYFLLNWLLDPLLIEFLSPFFCPVRPIRIAIDENEPADGWGSWFLNCLAELICGMPEKSKPLFSAGIPLALLW